MQSPGASRRGTHVCAIAQDFSNDIVRAAASKAGEGVNWAEPLCGLQALCAGMLVQASESSYTWLAWWMLDPSATPSATSEQKCERRA